MGAPASPGRAVPSQPSRTRGLACPLVAARGLPMQVHGATEQCNVVWLHSRASPWADGSYLQATQRLGGVHACSWNSHRFCAKVSKNGDQSRFVGPLSG